MAILLPFIPPILSRRSFAKLCDKRLASYNQKSKASFEITINYHLVVNYPRFNRNVTRFRKPLIRNQEYNSARKLSCIVEQCLRRVCNLVKRNNLQLTGVCIVKFRKHARTILQRWNCTFFFFFWHEPWLKYQRRKAL